MHLLSNARSCIAIGLALYCIATLGGEPDAPEHHDPLQVNQQLTLRDLLLKTFERNPIQHELLAMDSVARARAVHAGGILPAAPSVMMRRQTDTLGSGRGESEWEAGLELPVWLPGQRDARTALAQIAASDLEASRSALLLKTAGDLRDALWNIRMNSHLAELAELRLRTARALQNDVERRFRAGELARTDTMLAENDTLLANSQLVRAQAELMHARHRYTVLSGMTEMPGRIEEPLAEQTALDATHPLIHELETKLSLAQNERELVQVERRENPQVLLSARSLRGAFDSQHNDSVGITVRIPLDTETRAAPLLAAAESNISRALSDLERLRFVMQTALHEAQHNLETTRSELAILQRQDSLARENQRLAKKAFDLGEIDLVSLMRVQALGYEAERALGSKQIQLQWDIARVNQALGVVP